MMDHPNILAAGSEFIGIIVFIAYAILSVIGKRLSAKEEKSDEVVLAPPKNQTNSPTTHTPQDEAADELKRFKEEMKAKAKRRAASKQMDYQKPKSLTPQIKKQQNQPPPLITPQKTHSLVEEDKIQEALKSEEVGPVIQEEFIHNQTAIPSQSKLRRSLRENPTSLKQAIVMMEVLGKPRCMSPLR
jgi:hypothetical protein